MRTQSHLAGTLLLIAAPLAGAQGPVLVVDPGGGPGVDYLDLQPAIDGAADGSTLLVQEGSYTSFTIDGKSLAIVADVGASVTTGAVAIVNLAAGQFVHLRGIRAEVSGIPFRLLTLENNAGSIWIEESRFVPEIVQIPVKSAGDTDVAAWIRNSATVLLVRSEISGHEPLPGGAVGSDVTEGLVSIDSDVALYDCQVTGGKGVTSEPLFGAFYDGTTGETGVRVEGGFFFASGTTIVGGAGGDGALSATGACTNGGEGGVGLLTDGNEPVVVLFDSTVAGGSGGLAGGVSCTDGAAGAPSMILAGELTVPPGEARGMEAWSPTPESQPSLLTYAGEPGDLVVLAAGAAPAFAYWQALAGVRLTTPFVFVPQGIVNPAGELSVVIPPPGLAPGTAAAMFHLQPVFLDGAGALWLGAPSTMVVLDDGT